MSSTVPDRLYKLPRKNTYPAGILVQLLNGKRITNAEMMLLLKCPHAATAMSHLRNRCNWQPFLHQRGKSTVSGMGDATHEQEYWFEPMDIEQLKANDPRIEKFLISNRKS